MLCLSKIRPVLTYKKNSNVHTDYAQKNQMCHRIIYSNHYN